MVLITTEYLDQHRGAGGAWTKAQLTVLGLRWPPVTGWRARVSGMELSEEDARRFEDGKNIVTQKTVRLRAGREISRLTMAGEVVPPALVEQAKKPPQTIPTNPKSIRRAAKKAQRKKNNPFNQEVAAGRGATRPKKAVELPSVPVIYRPSKPKTEVRGVDVRSDEFLGTYEWRSLRMLVLKEYGAKCMCCGATPATGAVMNIDHIKPRKTHPELALSFDNLQVLCHDCNHGKGNWDSTDWRPKVAVNA